MKIFCACGELTPHKSRDHFKNCVIIFYQFSNSPLRYSFFFCLLGTWIIFGNRDFEFFRILIILYAQPQNGAMAWLWQKFLRFHQKFEISIFDENHEFAILEPMWTFNSRNFWDYVGNSKLQLSVRIAKSTTFGRSEQPMAEISKSW